MVTVAQNANQAGANWTTHQGDQGGFARGGLSHRQAGQEPGRLRRRPAFDRRLEPLLARLGEVQLLGAAVGRGRLDFDQPIAFERHTDRITRRAGRVGIIS